MNELNKMDEIDRRVVLWCARHHAADILHVLHMYQRDYELKGILLNVQALLSEVNDTACNK